jgi:hypothetical protein
LATHYDPSIIRQFADRLYAQADMIMYRYAVYGFVIGGTAGCGLSLIANNRDSPLIPAMVVGLILGALAAAIGRERGFTLRLQAQTALCQVQIEANSRGLNSVAGR